MQTPITKQITVENIDAQALYNEFLKLSEKIEQLQRLNSAGPAPNVLWTRQETAKHFKLSLPTIDDYTNKGILKGYRLGRFVRYKESEVLQAPVPITRIRCKSKKRSK